MYPGYPARQEPHECYYLRRIFAWKVDGKRSNRTPATPSPPPPPPPRAAAAADAAPRLLFGTVDGAVGCILPISADEYAFFRSLEKALASVAPAVGDLPHDEWRAFANERKQSPARGFVDGDLVETLVDLKGAQLERVVALMKEDGCECTAASLVERVEDMARSH